ncbi:hypothetical protein EDC94DRAFT_522969 [Helicostylum pulchrum]|nr:hypothetical protein EDC94DRAFT_522969 [Helicostylum pulchrum]
MSLPPLIFFSLTPEEDNDSYPQSPQDYEESATNWIDDSECQENLFHILSLTPEETIIDKDNHCIITSFQIFFEELGYFTEEPEPIDPNRDYEAEAKILLNQRDNKKVVRQKHVDLSRIPSLEYSSRSGLSSSSSSIHHEHHLADIRSPHYMGIQHQHQHSHNHSHHHSNSHTHGDSAYHYSEKHNFIPRPSRLH